MNHGTRTPCRFSLSATLSSPAKSPPVRFCFAAAFSLDPCFAVFSSACRQLRSHAAARLSLTWLLSISAAVADRPPPAGSPTPRLAAISIHALSSAARCRPSLHWRHSPRSLAPADFQISAFPLPPEHRLLIPLSAFLRRCFIAADRVSETAPLLLPPSSGAAQGRWSRRFIGAGAASRCWQPVRCCRGSVSPLKPGKGDARDSLADRANKAPFIGWV